MLLILAIASFVALGFQQWLHSRERQTLLDRIQAPERVVEQRMVPTVENLPQAVHPDSDLEYWESKGIDLASLNVEVPS